MTMLTSVRRGKTVRDEAVPIKYEWDDISERSCSAALRDEADGSLLEFSHLCSSDLGEQPRASRPSVDPGCPIKIIKRSRARENTTAPGAVACEWGSARRVDLKRPIPAKAIVARPGWDRCLFYASSRTTHRKRRHKNLAVSPSPRLGRGTLRPDRKAERGKTDRSFSLQINIFYYLLFCFIMFSCSFMNSSVHTYASPINS